MSHTAITMLAVTTTGHRTADAALTAAVDHARTVETEHSRPGHTGVVWHADRDLGALLYDFATLYLSDDSRRALADRLCQVDAPELDAATDPGARPPRPEHDHGQPGPCATCGGPTFARASLTRRYDPDRPEQHERVHLHDADWRDNVHHAVLAPQVSAPLDAVVAAYCAGHDAARREAAGDLP